MQAPTRFFRIAFVAVFALVASSAARAQTRMPTHVACVGDSITYGYGASSSSKSYPSVLQTMFSGVTVGNFGRNSATLLSVGDLPYINQSEYTSATTFVANAGASATVDVIIMLGTNDSKSYNWAPTAGSTRAQQFMTDLSAMVDHFTNLATHPVVFLAIPPAIYTNSFGISETVTNNEIAPIIRQVATQKGMPIIDVHAKTVSRADLFSDGVHPTDAGYTYLAQVMHDGLLAATTTGSGGAGGAGRGGAGGSGGGSGGAGASGSTGTGGRGGSGGRAGAGGTGGGAGSAGSTGSTGGAGTSGSTGTAGRGGAGGGTAGSAGATGAAGSSGNAGTTGGAGISGSGGRAGTTGGAGTSGSAGTTGGTTGVGGAGGAPSGTGGKAAADGGAGAAGSGNDGGGGCSVGSEPRGGAVVVGLAMIALVLCRSRRRTTRAHDCPLPIQRR